MDEIKIKVAFIYLISLLGLQYVVGRAIWIVAAVVTMLLLFINK